MSVEKGGIRKFLNFKVFLSALTIIIIVLAFIGYSTYSIISDFQNEQKDLRDEFALLNSQINTLQTELNASQNANNMTQLELADLQSQFYELLAEYNKLLADYNTIESQYDFLQTQYSSLQTSFTKFVAENQIVQAIQPYNYLIYSDGTGNYYAKNGATGIIDFSGTSGTQVGQNSINALSTDGGKIIFVGTIILEGPLLIHNETYGRLEISGFGASTQLVASQNSDGIHIIGTQPFGYGGPYHVSIRDLVITSTLTRTGRFVKNGIYIKNWFGVDIQNVMIFYANNSGILIEESANVQLDNVYVEGCSGTEYGGTQPLAGSGIWLSGSKDCYLRNCYSDTNYDGFRITANSATGSMPRSIFLTQSEATLNQRLGIYLSEADGIVLTESLIEGSNSDGILIADSYRISINNALVIGNVGNGVLITSENLNMTQSQILIDGCTIKSNNQNGIMIWAKNNMPITQIGIESSTIILSGTGARGNPSEPNTWDGILIGDNADTSSECRYVKITNCYFGNIAGANPTQAYGIRSIENSNYIQIFNNNFFNNLAGNYNLVGVNNEIAYNIDE